MIDQSAAAVTHADLETLTTQLGRPVRGVRAIAYRCGSGHPTVVETAPRLPDGTPFPTLYYLTCPAACAAVGRLESVGVMADMTLKLHEDELLQLSYERAHADYISRREQIAKIPEIAGISAGGMPHRVKCLHALVGHSLAVGAGANPFGDEALELLAATWTPSRCDWMPH